MRTGLVMRYSPIVQLTLLKVRSLVREPEALFWVFVFPVLLAVALGIALPTPGGAGGFHAAMTFGLNKLFGVPQAVAVGAGFLLHLMTVVPVLVIGALLLLLDRLPFHDLLEAARQVKQLGAPTAPETISDRPVERAPLNVRSVAI